MWHVQLNESTGVTHPAKLLFMLRYVYVDDVKNRVFVLQIFGSYNDCKRHFKVVLDIFEEHSVKWKT
jgi:hypothetical protein